MQKTNQGYEIGKDIFVTSTMLRRYIDRQMPCEELNGGQGRILGMIVMWHQQNQPLYQRDIETEFRIRGSSVTSILKNMEKKGLITRISSEKDARLKRLLPTGEGIRIHNLVRDRIMEAESNMLVGVKREELKVFREVLEKLRTFVQENE